MNSNIPHLEEDKKTYNGQTVNVHMNTTDVMTVTTATFSTELLDVQVYDQHPQTDQMFKPFPLTLADIASVYEKIQGFNADCHGSYVMAHIEKQLDRLGCTMEDLVNKMGQ